MREMSVRLLNANVTKRNLCPHSYTTREIDASSFATRRIIGGRWTKVTPPFKNSNFRAIFARSASTVTLSEISSITNNRKCTKSFPMNSVRCR